MNELLILVTMGILVEAVVEVIKSIYDNGKMNKVILLSILVGILFAFTLQVDIFQLLGIEVHIDYVGIVATGMIISRGSNFVHDIISQLRGE